jgi:type VI secretion system secreted protein Hcp
MNPPAAASDTSGSDIFLAVQTKRAGKLKGEASTPGHVDDIEVRSMTWGVSSPTAVGAVAATARRQYKHLVIVKGIDSASTGLLSALVSNDEVKEAKLTLRKAGGDALDYWTMTLSKARVIGVDLEVDPHGRPTESVSIAYAQIEIEYKRQQGAGTSGASTSFADEVLATS